MLLQDLLELNWRGLLQDIVVFIPVVLVALSVHEFAHAWAADALGDPTPRRQGRLTLDPRAHLDPAGALFFLVAGFGWGKPVQVDARRLASPRRDMALVAAAGPFSNVALALLAILAWDLVPMGALGDFGTRTFWLYVREFILLDLLLALFNLIPIPPLDGSRLLMAVLPGRTAAAMARLQPLLFALIAIGVFSGYLGRILNPVLAVLAGWAGLLITHP
ncbi:MAG TPA: site-2 protease family protein [Limnochordia bacterium]|nr:site-2 protease family protein [Limnochordia bacterium]